MVPVETSDQSKLSLTINLRLPSYIALGLPLPTYTNSDPSTPYQTASVMDTGARVSLCPIESLTQLGIKPYTILPLHPKIEGPGASTIPVLGGIIVEVSAQTTDGGILLTDDVRK